MANPILPNVIISTQRPTFNAATKATTLPGTTTTGGVTAGSAVSIPVASSASLSINQSILLDTLGSGVQETAVISSIPDGTHIVATLAKNHASGIPVTGLYLTGVVASLSEIDQVGYARLAALGEGMLAADYQMNVGSGTDIALADRITTITRFLDGVTWPTDLGPSAQQVWSIIYVRESSPGFLAERVLFIKRGVGAGPTH